MLKRASIILRLAIVLLIMLCVVSCSSKEETYEKDISEYNTEQYPLPKYLFFKELPDYVRVESFVYCELNEGIDFDYYLELKFNSAEELDKYLSDLLAYCKEYLIRKRIPTGCKEWFIEEQNPYNSSYTDLFCLGCVLESRYNWNYLGYRYDIMGNTPSSSANYAVISYSFDELTVIQTQCRYQYYDQMQTYVPRYFKKFDIPILDKELNRVLFDQMRDVDQDKFEIVDLTDKMTDFMETNAADLQAYKDKHGTVLAMIYFYNNVNDGGIWDIKLQDDWKFQPETVYIFRGKQMRSDDTGNICYAYIGAVIFSKEAVCAGAGINQTTKYDLNYGDVSTWHDDPRDTVMISYGHDLYTSKEH